MYVYARVAGGNDALKTQTLPIISDTEIVGKFHRSMQSHYYSKAFMHYSGCNVHRSVQAEY